MNDAPEIASEYGRYRYAQGNRIGGRYLVHRCDSGGFGQVYLCYDEEADFFVALKTLKLTQQAVDNPATVARLKREVDLWIALGEHPHLVRCHSFSMIDQLPFMVLEWVADDDSLTELYQACHQGKPAFLDWYARLGRQGIALRANAETRNRESAGTSLAGWIKGHRRLSAELALRIARDVCAGLAHAQSVHPGLVHRDLKPANVLLTEQSRAKVSDFGIAQVAGEMLEGGQSFGTPEFMPPEQWRGEALDTRADIYALGCVLYSMLCGRPPFLSHTPNRQELRVQHERVTPVLPRQLFPSPLAQVIDKCLAKMPEARFASWAELDEALAACDDSGESRGSVKRTATEPATVEESNQLAVAYYHLERYADALTEFDRALRLDSTHANTYTNRGCVYHVLGQYDAALGDYSQAIRLGREEINAKVRNNRGLVYIATGRLARAVSDIERAIAREPDYANAHANLGVAHTLLGEHEQALASFTQALELAPKHVLALYNRGCVYELQGDRVSAQHDYEAAVEHNPLFSPARSRLRLLGTNGETVDMPAPELEFGLPDPQFENQGSLQEAIARPWVEQRMAQLWWDEKTGAVKPAAHVLPMKPVVLVRQVEYVGWLHAAILAKQATGERITQLALQAKLLGGVGSLSGEKQERECCVWLDEEAMRMMAVAGLHNIYDLAGRFVTLRRMHPDDAEFPMRIEIIH